jgi:dTDP-4-amino-4,6-dideoxygalactose transaminase
VIRINEDQFGLSRDEVYEKLKEYNVYTRKYFYPLCSNFDCYANYDSSQKEKLPVANEIVKQVLSLPFYGELGEDRAKKIAKLLVRVNSGDKNV